MIKSSDTAILNLGDIGEENTFTATTDKGNMTSTVHSFEDKLPDSALDADDEGIIELSCRNFHTVLEYSFRSTLIDI